MMSTTIDGRPLVVDAAEIDETPGTRMKTHSINAWYRLAPVSWE